MTIRCHWTLSKYLFKSVPASLMHSIIFVIAPYRTRGTTSYVKLNNISPNCPNFT
jgi:hypothetical protein